MPLPQRAKFESSLCLNFNIKYDKDKPRPDKIYESLKKDHFDYFARH